MQKQVAETWKETCSLKGKSVSELLLGLIMAARLAVQQKAGAVETDPAGQEVG